MKTLDNCRWTPKWVSHLGCIKSCLDFLEIDISDAWLYGGTGHAFVINIHDVVCPSGPTAWKTMMLFELASNLGYRLDGVFGFKQQEDFAKLQASAFEHVKQAIDQGQPCYGWELEIPEFYVIYGYDEAGAETADASTGGYYYSGPGCEAGKGPKPWRELGDTGIGVLEIYSVWPTEPADDATTVKQALTYALKHAANDEDWIFEDYRAGLEGYDNWIGALERGDASDMGMRYNTGVWLECRRYAVDFLKEAKTRLAGRADSLFDEAVTHYQTIADRLGTVSELYPWSYEASDEDSLPINDHSKAAVEALQSAKAAEAAGLQTLEKLVATL